jgi:hypothetical protein
VPERGPFARLLVVSGSFCAGAVALAGALALGFPGLVGTGVAGAVTAALVAGVAREAPHGGRASVADTAWKAGAGTVGGILLISGLVVLTGGVVATLLTGLAAAAALALWLLRERRRAAARAGRPEPPVPLWAVRPDRAELPVGALPTAVLGEEWLRTTAALAGRLDPAARQAVVRRRQETLDELERRDPDGFARWLAAGTGGDPALFVRRDVRDLRGGQAAGTDAA